METTCLFLSVFMFILDGSGSLMSSISSLINSIFKRMCQISALYSPLLSSARRPVSSSSNILRRFGKPAKQGALPPPTDLECGERIDLEGKKRERKNLESIYCPVFFRYLNNISYTLDCLDSFPNNTFKEIIINSQPSSFVITGNWNLSLSYAEHSKRICCTVSNSPQLPHFPDSCTLKNAGLFFQPKCWVETAG